MWLPILSAYYTKFNSSFLNFRSALSGECRQGFLIKNQGEIHETTTPKPSLRRVGNDALFLYPDFYPVRVAVEEAVASFSTKNDVGWY